MKIFYRWSYIHQSDWFWLLWQYMILNWNSWMWKQYFFIEIWRSRSSCINLRALKNMTKNIWCTNWRHHCIVWNSLLTGDIKDLIFLWLRLDILGLNMIIVFILEDLVIYRIFICYFMLMICWLLLRVWLKWIKSSLTSQWSLT